ncbi:MAG TPA: GAF domain-containing protein, partial [Polyangiaceae bacterium]|nr:GAF domain-containing protein [Polyangiaceae bacterium]
LPLSYGTAPISPFFYEQYGIVHTVVTSDYQTAHRFGQLGLMLSERPEYAAARGPVLFIYAGFNSHWCRPIAESIEHFRLGVSAGLDSGDPMHAAYCVGVGTAYRIYAGEPLDQLAADLPGYRAVLTASNDFINLGFLAISERTVACLRGETERFGSMDGAAFTEAEFEATAPPPVAAMYGAHKAMLRYLSGASAEALEATERFQPLPGLFYNVEYKLYHALALADLARRAAPEARTNLMARLRADVEQHAIWAKSCEQNFGHRYTLLCAELAALEGQSEPAMTLYDRAIAEASSHGAVLHLALANELCGRFHYAASRTRVARTYLIEARYHYERWGATAKAAHLDVTYSELDLVGLAQDPMQTRRLTATRTRALGGAGGTLSGDSGLDLMSAIRAAQAIASELELDRLIERLLRIVVENAGARRGALILPRGEQLRVSATISVDPDRVELGLDEALAESQRVPTSLIQYVARSKESVVLDDSAKDQRFAQDPYLTSRTTKSLLGLPLFHQGVLSAILFLENAAVAGVFHASRLERLNFLGAHAAVAIENAKLYGQVQAARRSLEEANDTLEQKVKARTAALSQRNDD